MGPGGSPKGGRTTSSWERGANRWYRGRAGSRIVKAAGPLGLHREVCKVRQARYQKRKKTKKHGGG